ncbi:DUF218 domain-containing protein [Sphingobacterium nematocida]|uniref:DUF218 domain-containing protein n=1 Tax=Sphingobacterium nematocida TaxID=1513896 RepID=A0A1T5GQ61_9SPHI|nr:ElyC/SanA/YdcF family protein [Sphingobacterium nematocida]SKC10543.1 DUF218 domain-containing protein [Sphingobacterium nematocida]
MQKYNSTEGRIREIAKLPNVPELSDNMIVALSDLCFYQSPVKNSDLLFVFGSNVLHKEIANEISRILFEFQIPTTIITGGIANYSSSYFEPIAESELIFCNIEKDNFPNTQFIIENESKNTLENIEFSNSMFDFSKVQNAIFLSHSYASMRSYLNLKKFCKNADFSNCQIKIPSDIQGIPVDINNWYKTDHGRKLVWGEYLRFKTYGTRGDFPIEEVQNKLSTIEDIILNLSEL